MANKAARRAEPDENDDGTVRVFLARSVGLRGGQLYGPGWANVPRELYNALELSPEPVQTDHTGAPLTNSMAASALPPRLTTTGTAVPVPARDEETGEELEPDDENIPANETAAARHAREVGEAAESGERTGNRLVAETGSHLDEGRTLQPHPGQLEPSWQQEQQAARDVEEAERRAAIDRGDVPPARGSRTSRGSGAGSRGAGNSSNSSSDEDGKPATKTALQEYGDRDALAELAKSKGVKVDEGDTKREIVDKLHDAGVTLED